MSDGPSPPPPSAGSDLVGRVLAGRYRIERKLGDGAMGAVYLGEHLKFGRLDAIKVLREGMARDAEATERFLRGARNASRINHPNVCTVYDFGDTDDGQQFLAMEFVDGETLADVLETEGRLAPARAVEIVRQIGDALDAAHDLGIVHRDLKPGNVMLARGRDGADQVKVVDFDIAKGSADGEGSEVTRTGFVVGTPEYMSPEQLIGDPLDGRSDVYSLALVFVRILTGRLPARAESTQDLMVERLTQDPLTLGEIAPDLSLPAGVQAALDHALQRRREDRPATAGVFTAALVRGLEGRAATPAASPGTATPPPPSPPASAPPASAPPPATGPKGVPATTVGAVPSSGTASPAPPPGPPALRRLAPWVVGGLAVVAAGWGALQVMGRDGGEPPTEPPATADTDGPADTDPPGTDLNDPTDTDPTDTATTDDPVDPRAAGTDDPIAADPDDPPPDDADPVDPPADPTPPPSATGVEDQLFRQLDALTLAPGAATWAAARDTARAAWDETRLPESVRALAAYVTASAFDAEGRTAEAVPWARRAVDLAPGNRGFRTLLDKLGGGRP